VPAVVAPGNPPSVVHRHVTAGVVVDVTVSQFRKDPFSGPALHRPARLPCFSSVIAVDGGVVVVGPPLLIVVALGWHNAAGNQQSALVLAGLQRDAGFRMTQDHLQAVRSPVSGCVRLDDDIFLLPRLPVVPAAIEIPVFADDQHVTAVVVDNDVSPGVRPDFPVRAPSPYLVLAATDASASIYESQYSPVLRDDDLGRAP